ncbi:MAG TPA: arginine--tRNA ligase [Blastocatellia bacterium]|nr:arginine--tRNA ligase [Blastocatellia bacterium]
MSSSLAAEIKQRLLALVSDHFNLALDDVASEVPPRTELGDLAFPVAFELAKRLKAATGEKKNPREIAAKLAEGLSSIPGIAKVEIAGAGYLNVFFDRAQLFTQLVSETPRSATRASQAEKLIVEHTSINPNKAAHIGHVRNAVLGDTVVRILKATGENVEVHNYIDNTGVQVADVVVGFIHLENKSLEEIKAIAERPVTRREESFDYYCWELYARVGQWYEEDKSRLELRARTLHEIEEGASATAEIGEYISARIVDCHLNTMARLEISYDLLARESEILHLHFWAHAFEKLKERGVIVFETEGRNKGCWVMRAEESQSSEAKSETAESEHDADKIIVRSNGTVTYTGKDIAYHLWKLGKLGLDFHYRPLRNDHHGHEVWITTGDDSAAAAVHPPFGNGTAFLNVIDVGQSYPQANVKRAVMLMAANDEQRAKVARSAHLAYEKVTLSADAAKELGVDAEGAVSMSGRKGLGVKADDLIDRLEASALKEVQARHTDISLAEQQQIAHQIAVAALRYFLLKYTRTSIIAFDFKEALSFEGETGPYIQYSAVRARNIFRKLGRTADELREDFARLTAAQINEILSGEGGNELWSLIYFAARLTDIAQLAATGFEPTHVAKYAFQLAKQFNLFYHNHHILSETDEARKTLLLFVAEVTRQRLEQALSLLGIETPERM